MSHRVEPDTLPVVVRFGAANVVALIVPTESVPLVHMDKFPVVPAAVNALCNEDASLNVRDDVVKAPVVPLAYNNCPVETPVSHKVEPETLPVVVRFGAASVVAFKVPTVSVPLVHIERFPVVPAAVSALCNEVASDDVNEEVVRAPDVPLAYKSAPVDTPVSQSVDPEIDPVLVTLAADIADALRVPHDKVFPLAKEMFPPAKPE